MSLSSGLHENPFAGAPPARADRALRRRLGVAFGGLIALFAALAFRLVHVQVIAAGDYRAAGKRQASVRLTRFEPRGEIRDARGSPLAYTEAGFDLWAEPPKVERPGEAAEEVARALGADPLSILGRFARGGKRVLVRRGLSIEDAERVRRPGIPGLDLEESALRKYPLGLAAAHVTGAVGLDGRGLEGLEYVWDEALAGREGWRELGGDARRRMFEIRGGAGLPGVPGTGLVLTVDSGLQLAAWEEMSRAADALAPVGGSAVVMDPRTGDVLALVSWPSYAPPERGRAPPGAARNRAVQDALAPGSTMKPLVVAWALDRGAVRPGEKIDCEMGAWRALPSRVIHDTHPLGVITVEEVLIHSSNIAAAKIGRRLGADRLYECVRAFGFGERTGIGLPGESGGIVGPRAGWSEHSILSIPFGQELTATPLQLASGYAALINGGLFVRPRLIKGLVDERGRVLRAFPRDEPARVVSESTSLWARRTLARAVEEGTGRRARVKGLAVGGKTGTAQTFERDPATGRTRVSSTRSVLSFAGFAPAEEPRLVCIVMWDGAANARYGGQAAAPVAGAILRRAVFELGF